MSQIKLYDTECLVYTEYDGKCEYWVLRVEGVSPLPHKLRVRKKDLSTAVALFKDHPDGIEKVEHVRGVDDGVWEPNEVLEHSNNQISKAEKNEQL